MERTLVIGDIHGGLRALTQVFERASLKKTDRLVFLGDYVDGWSESARLIDYLISLAEQQSCVFIRGNHDIWCEEWLRTGEVSGIWLFNGGATTIESYRSLDANAKQRHLRFFEQTKYYEVDELNRLFIHAGFTSMQGPQQEFDPHSFAWDRTLWEMAAALGKRVKRDSLLFPRRLKLFHEIYIGHTPTLNFDVDTPMHGCNVWNIDTGAAFRGKLSVMNIKTKKFWQSDPVFSLYPGEMGRNRD